MNRSTKISQRFTRSPLFAGDISPNFLISQFLKRNVQLNVIRLKTILAVCVFAACLAISPSSQAQQCLKGDVNLDGTINMSDVLPFVDLLVSGEYLCEADAGDGQIDFNDAFGLRLKLLEQADGDFTDTATDGAGDFFWSTSDLNEGAINGPIDLNLSPGESVTLFLYYSTNGPSNTDIEIGYSLNVATSQNGIVQFTQADTFNHPDIFGNGFFKRWEFPRDDTLDGQVGVGVVQAQSVESDLIIGLTAMNILSGVGISDQFITVDSGYDSDAQAFLCGRIEIEAIAPGTIELAAGPNDLGIAHQYALLQSAFARANISVGDTLLGDVSLDGMVNFQDITYFIGVLSTAVYQAEADCNEDTYVDFRDISFFIDILSGN